MHSFEVHSNERSYIKSERLGLEQVTRPSGRRDIESRHTIIHMEEIYSKAANNFQN